MTKKDLKYFVSEEQVRIHQQRNFKEILQWLHETNYFLKMIQTEEEKKIMKLLKDKK
ncbi:MAG: hypothetical protein ACK4IK_07200 [Bacteroidia bacterium]